MFDVTVRTAFEATHALRDDRGEGEPLHAHRWRCEVTIAATSLDRAGCAIDFHEVDAILARAIEPFAGRSLCACSLFSEESPSAENIARALFFALAEELKTPSRRVSRVTVWEDDDHRASYYE